MYFFGRATNPPATAMSGSDCKCHQAVGDLGPDVFGIPVLPAVALVGVIWFFTRKR